MRALRTSLLSCAVLAGALPTPGCYRYQTQVPGVIDLRTDASETPLARPSPPDDDELTRKGAVGVVMGRGVQLDRSRVTVEDRHVFLRGLVPVFNSSAYEELDVALTLGGGLRSVEIGEQYGIIDVGITLVSVFVPIVGYLAPSTYTFEASGEVLALEPGAADRGRALPSPLPLDELPPPPPFEAPE